MFLSKFFAVAGLATLALGVSATAAFAAGPSGHSNEHPVTTTSYDTSGRYCPPEGSRDSQYGDSQRGMNCGACNDNLQVHNYLTADERGILPWEDCFPLPVPKPHCVTQTVSMWYDHGQLVTNAMVTPWEHLKLDGVTYTVLGTHGNSHGLYDVTLSPSVPWWLHGGILDFKSGFCALR